MPQASKELRDEWPGWDTQAINHLRDRGYRLTRSADWVSPPGNHEVTERDWSAIQYLIDEWDYGGLVG